MIWLKLSHDELNVFDAIKDARDWGIPKTDFKKKLPNTSTEAINLALTKLESNGYIKKAKCNKKKNKILYFLFNETPHASVTDTNILPDLFV